MDVLPQWYLKQAREYISGLQIGYRTVQESHEATRQQRLAEGRLQQLWAGRGASPEAKPARATVSRTFTPLSFDDIDTSEPAPIRPLEHSQLAQTRRLEPAAPAMDTQKAVFGVRYRIAKRPAILGRDTRTSVLR